MSGSFGKTPILPRDEHATEALGEPLAPSATSPLPVSLRFVLAFITLVAGTIISFSSYWMPRLDAWHEARAVAAAAPPMPRRFECSRAEFGKYVAADTFQIHIHDRKNMLVLHCRDSGKAGA